MATDFDELVTGMVEDMVQIGGAGSLELSIVGDGEGRGERDVGEMLSGVSRAGLLWEEGRLTRPLRNYGS